jgi:hypothetical protein
MTVKPVSGNKNPAWTLNIPSGKGWRSKLGILKTFRHRYRAHKAADKMWNLLGPSFAPFRAPAGQLDEKMRTDEFLLSYMYGVFSAVIVVADSTDTAQVGFTLWECYNRLFPRQGKQALSLCNLRLEEGSEKFKRGVAKGLKEMNQVYDSKGQSGLPSLTKHIFMHYVAR